MVLGVGYDMKGQNAYFKKVWKYLNYVGALLVALQYSSFQLEQNEQVPSTGATCVIFETMMLKSKLE